MFALKWLLMAAGVAMFGTAAGVMAYDVYLAMQFQKLMGSGEPGAAGEAGERRPILGQFASRARTPRWSLAMKLFAWVCGRYLPRTIYSRCAEKPAMVQKQFA